MERAIRKRTGSDTTLNDLSVNHGRMEAVTLSNDRCTVIREKGDARIAGLDKVGQAVKDAAVSSDVEPRSKESDVSVNEECNKDQNRTVGAASVGTRSKDTEAFLRFAYGEDYDAHFGVDDATEQVAT